MSRYLKSLYRIMKPLIQLLKADCEWTWDKLQQQAFQDVMSMMLSPAALCFYERKLPMLVNSDASSFGIGGVLTSSQDG